MADEIVAANLLGQDFGSGVGGRRCLTVSIQVAHAPGEVTPDVTRIDTNETQDWVKSHPRVPSLLRPRSFFSF
jgi:hypothetical protein